mmetsp:Transcript_30372/g.77489  ORF Transcript_30372/g.77489 Transcript_30372/m.77489 type:complete len:147 (-) Transcript_30372:631-1071(-)
MWGVRPEEPHWASTFSYWPRFRGTRAFDNGYGPDFKVFELGEVQIQLAETLDAANDVVEGLRNYAEEIDSSTFGLDMEWRPDTRGTSNPVSLIQISCWDRVALLNVAAFGYHLPGGFWDSHPSTDAAGPRRVFCNVRVGQERCGQA